MGYYWKEVGYNCYVLWGDTEEAVFTTYKELYNYCMSHGIDATQA